MLGADPSLRNWGIAAGQYNTETNELTIKRLEVIRAVLPEGKQVRQNSEDLSAAQQLYKGMAPYLPGVHLMFAEVPVGSQNSRSMASYGICVGVLGAVRANEHPFFEVTPTEVKLATVGKKTATKNEMIEWAMARFPNAPWPMHGKKVNAGLAEHMADACAAIVAGLQGNEYKQLAAMRYT